MRAPIFATFSPRASGGLSGRQTDPFLPGGHTSLPLLAKQRAHPSMREGLEPSLRYVSPRIKRRVVREFGLPTDPSALVADVLGRPVGDGLTARGAGLRAGAVLLREDEAADVELPTAAEPNCEVAQDEESGAFVHFTSTSGLIGNFGQANYSAAKLGIVGLSKSIALDMERFNVRSNCVSPFAWSRLIGTIPTET